MHKGVLNKQGKFGVKILWRCTDMAIFVLRCFILTHPVVNAPLRKIVSIALHIVYFVNLARLLCM